MTELNLMKRAVAINAAILEAFKDPETGFTIEFQRAKGRIGTAQGTLDALRAELDRTMPANTGVQLGTSGSNLDSWKQALTRQTEVLRGIIHTMDGQAGVYSPNHYAMLASKAPARPGGVAIQEGAPMPFLSHEYKDMIAQLNTATAKALANRCTPVSVSPAGDKPQTLTFPVSQSVQGPGCSRT